MAVHHASWLPLLSTHRTSNSLHLHAIVHLPCLVHRAVHWFVCRHLLRILNPTVAIEVALEDCRASDNGFGPQRLATLASYALRLGLLSWLQDAQVLLDQNPVCALQEVGPWSLWTCT